MYCQGCNKTFNVFVSNKRNVLEVLYGAVPCSHYSVTGQRCLLIGAKCIMAAVCYRSPFPSLRNPNPPLSLFPLCRTIVRRGVQVTLSIQVSCLFVTKLIIQITVDKRTRKSRLKICILILHITSLQSRIISTSFSKDLVLRF